MAGQRQTSRIGRPGWLVDRNANADLARMRVKIAEGQISATVSSAVGTVAIGKAVGAISDVSLRMDRSAIMSVAILGDMRASGAKA